MNTPMDSKIQVKDLCKSYEKKLRIQKKKAKNAYVLDHINLEIQENEIVCIMGKSGSGKTTLLNLIGGLIKPEKGQILVSGEEIHGPSKERGIVFQDYVLFPWFTVYENVAFGPKMQGYDKSKIEQIASKYIELVELTEYKDYYPSQLSGGMKQRVSIARALANRPEILIMDEPFSALDKVTREAMHVLLYEHCKKQKTTVLMVTHSAEEALHLADRIIVIGDCHIKLDLNVRKIKEEQKEEFNEQNYHEIITEAIH